MTTELITLRIHYNGGTADLHCSPSKMGEQVNHLVTYGVWDKKGEKEVFYPAHSIVYIEVLT